MALEVAQVPSSCLQHQQGKQSFRAIQTTAWGSYSFNYTRQFKVLVGQCDTKTVFPTVFCPYSVLVAPVGELQIEQGGGKREKSKCQGVFTVPKKRKKNERHRERDFKAEVSY